MRQTFISPLDGNTRAPPSHNVSTLDLSINVSIF